MESQTEAAMLLEALERCGLGDTPVWLLEAELRYAQLLTEASDAPARRRERARELAESARQRAEVLGLAGSKKRAERWLAKLAPGA